MKRVISCLLVVLLIASAVPLAAAKDNNSVYFDDGSYITIDISVVKSRAAGSVSGSKTYTYHDSDGTSAWKAVLSGTFSYTGSTSTCTASSCNVTIYDSAWYTVSKSASKSGNSATAAVTMGKKLLGVTITKVPVNMVLTCDANGNLS